MVFALEGHVNDTKKFSPTRPATLEHRDEPGRRPPSSAHLPHLTVPEPGGRLSGRTPGRSLQNLADVAHCQTVKHYLY
ncbi:hypothetical protein E2C01_085562 [Portunus trituberculatus]|uniref:Uncharacterized protein n=1 Tax=Portunus trituberculatus TaxID=210409 RepID=A0A5B7JC90_PORTR|nr:hypothetical protein [Portunus trituberculatus]